MQILATGNFTGNRADLCFIPSRHCAEGAQASLVSLIIIIQIAIFSRCSTSITRTKKSVYPRVYKVRLQQPDGSSYTIRYHEPHELIRLPVDPNSLTEEEKQARLNRLKPEKEIKVHEFDDEETEIIQRSWKDFVASR